jgi:hypothetical protein
MSVWVWKIAVEISILNDYIATRILSLDTHAIKNSCYRLENVINEQFANQAKLFYYPEAPATTGLYDSYNLMMYPFEGFYELFTEVKNTFHEFRLRNDVPHTKFYMQCWLNVFKKDQYVDWHHHWMPEEHAWHGFYCVQVGESNTEYLLPDGTHVTVTSKDNLLILSKSDGDKHKSSPWTDPNTHRITIAFDIVPDYTLRKKGVSINHWIPI